MPTLGRKRQMGLRRNELSTLIQEEQKELPKTRGHGPRRIGRLQHPLSKTHELIDRAWGYPVMQIRVPKIFAKFMKFTCWAFRTVGVLVVRAWRGGFEMLMLEGFLLQMRTGPRLEGLRGKASSSFMQPRVVAATVVPRDMRRRSRSATATPTSSTSTRKMLMMRRRSLRIKGVGGIED